MARKDEFQRTIHSVLVRWMPGTYRQELLKALKSELAVARRKAAEASQHFDDVVREASSGLPHPDGVQRIHNASRALSLARQALVETHLYLNAFMREGIVPERLRKGPERDDRGPSGR